jgi:hypothetical protein
MDQDLNDQIKQLRLFLQQNMITKEEFDQRISELPSKADFHQLQTSVDGIAGQFKERNQERVVAAERSTRMETWIMSAAKKIGLDYRP